MKKGIKIGLIVVSVTALAGLSYFLLKKTKSPAVVATTEEDKAIQSWMSQIKKDLAAQSQDNQLYVDSAIPNGDSQFEIFYT